MLLQAVLAGGKRGGGSRQDQRERRERNGRKSTVPAKDTRFLIAGKKVDLREL